MFNLLIKKERVFLPKSYFIELTNYCNLRCSMCNFHSPSIKAERSKGFMDIHLALNLLEQIGGFRGDAWVALHGAGEPLLHKGIFDVISFASKYKNIKCGFLTNAALLTKDTTIDLLDSGISWIGFSLDGIVKEKFEKYRIGSNFEQIMDNVMFFLDLNKKNGKKVNTLINMTVQEEMKGDVEDFIDFWIDKVDEVAISPCRPVGSRENILVDSSAWRQPCYMLYEMMVIYWDGEVGLCCEDWFNSGNMGNVRENSIIDVWHGRRFKKARQVHEKGDFHKIQLCRDCNSWFRTDYQEKDEEKGLIIQKNAWQYVYKRFNQSGELFL